MKENVDQVKLLFDRWTHVTSAAREPDMHRKSFTFILLSFKQEFSIKYL